MSVVKDRGHCLTSVGSLIGLSEEHHVYSYDLYQDNPARPLIRYTQEVYAMNELILGYDLISR